MQRMGPVIWELPGATIFTNISGREANQAMLATVARLDVSYVLMHIRGNPLKMVEMARYQDGNVVTGFRRDLAQKIRKALCGGIKRRNLIIDPGFGFAKDLECNYQLLHSLDTLQCAFPTNTRTPFCTDYASH
ncbi:hypothetical protein PtB15_4B119 [Puccinia triticina]|nr:hypothetical protein PtB15_4B119 [Puccinia triticina]